MENEKFNILFKKIQKLLGNVNRQQVIRYINYLATQEPAKLFVEYGIDADTFEFAKWVNSLEVVSL